MGFMSGRVSYVRFAVSGDSPLPFGEDLLEQASLHTIGRHGGADPTDGMSFGWAGGDHVLDTTLELGKNLFNDAFHLAMRVDTDKIPGSLLKAYTTIELAARAAMNPSGRPTKAQRTEAKEAGLIRAEAESADGRYRRMAASSILWDGQTNVVYAGVTSLGVLDRLRTLFRETFDRTLTPITAGTLAMQIAETRSGISIADIYPSGFVGEPQSSLAWADPEAPAPDFLGNEFLLWLWHTLQADSDTIGLSDGSEVTVMLAKTLTLDCPRGETGRDCMTDLGPTKLPEAFLALQSGKLPRKVGMILVRHDAQYELTVQAETLSVSGALMPKIEGATGDDLKVARVDALRNLVETMDLLFEAYSRQRTGAAWPGELGRIRRWLKAA